ncbi:DegT/DnrJ/EryC1/StrS aminotransferase family protein [Synechococcus sp. WH 8016]|uniref:DegT/DnrJ/EryC1/StrS family aminotransferase n=1 Tax=Synechococcus sp. WH 8016 TaxID=166318 RepID=UPI00022D9E92|nr:DegT/DnrJ/EryC1/StrS aminotransferase family protein [Synechococcus sp. WH 8016]EHA62386.1 Glutamine--scyllo-inositol transaminase [Synechococcus sp. WH 8016]
MSLPTWPVFDHEELNAVVRVLSSGKVNYWTGSEGKSFESEFAKWSNCSHAIAIANGSLALSAAYLSIDIGINDEVITTPRTFVATASSISLLRATPVFADVDINSGCITAETIEPMITPKTKAISVVHLGGWPADMQSICELAKHYGIKVVEDCAQAHGAQIKTNNKWRSVGSYADVSAWSFCQDKIMSTGGEGGMVTTNDSSLYSKVWSIKDHGKSFEKVNLPPNMQPSGFRWLHDSFGSNFRLTEMQSIIGREQLKKMEEWHDSRKTNARILISRLQKIAAIRIPIVPSNVEHAWYKFYCYVNPSSLRADWSRDRIVEEIKREGYPAFQGGCSEVYLEACFKPLGITADQRLPNAKTLGETSLMFLVHPSITPLFMDVYAQTISKTICRAIL